MARQGDRLDVEIAGEARLVAALVLGEADEHLPLRAGEIAAFAAMVEGAVQQPCDVTDEKAEIAVVGRSGSGGIVLHAAYIIRSLIICKRECCGAATASMARTPETV